MPFVYIDELSGLGKKKRGFGRMFKRFSTVAMPHTLITRKFGGKKKRKGKKGLLPSFAAPGVFPLRGYEDDAVLDGVGELGKKKKGIFGKFKKITGKVLKLTPIGMAATFAKKTLGKKKKKGGVVDTEPVVESEAPVTATTDAEQGVPETFPQTPAQYSQPQYAPEPAYPEQEPQEAEVVSAPPVETQFTEPGGEQDGMDGMIVTEPTPPYVTGETPPRSAAWLKQTKPAMGAGGRRVRSPFLAPNPRVGTGVPPVGTGRFRSPFLGPDIGVPRALWGIPGGELSGISEDILGAVGKAGYVLAGAGIIYLADVVGGSGKTALRVGGVALAVYGLIFGGKAPAAEGVVDKVDPSQVSGEITSPADGREVAPSGLLSHSIDVIFNVSSQVSGRIPVEVRFTPDRSTEYANNSTYESVRKGSWGYRKSLTLPSSMVARTGQPSVRGRLTLFVGGNRVAESIVFIKRD